MKRQSTSQAILLREVVDPPRITVMDLRELLPEPVAVSAIVFGCTWKGTVVVLLTAALLKTLQPRSAVLQHVVWRLVLASLCLLPILEVYVPWGRITVPIMVDSVSRGEFEAGQAVSRPFIGDFESRSDPNQAGTTTGIRSTGLGVNSPINDAGTSHSSNNNSQPASTGHEVTMAFDDLENESPSTASLRSNPIENAANSSMHAANPRFTSGVDNWAQTVRIDSLLIAAWSLGCLCALAYLSVRRYTQWSILAKSTLVTNGLIESIAREVVDEMDGPHSVQVFTSTTCRQIVSFPGHRCSIVLPNIAELWSAERLQFVLRYELALIATRSLLLDRIAVMGWILNWFNPVSWFALRSWADSRHLAADELASQKCRSPGEYAGQLALWAREHEPTVLRQVGTTYRLPTTRLQRRLERLLGSLPNPRRHTQSIQAFLVLIMLVSVGLLGSTCLKCVVDSPSMSTAILPHSPSNGTSNDGGQPDLIDDAQILFGMESDTTTPSTIQTTQNQKSQSDTTRIESPAGATKGT